MEMEIKLLDGVTATLPKIFYIYNHEKIKLAVTDETADVIKVASAGLEEERDVYNGYCEFDPFPFVMNGIEFEDVIGVDTPKFFGNKNLVFTMYKDGEQIAEGDITIMFLLATKAPTENYNGFNNAPTYMRNPNYPFAVTLVADDGYSNHYVRYIYEDGSVEGGTIDVKDIQQVEVPQNCKMMGIYANSTFNGWWFRFIQDTRTSGVYLRWLDRMGRAHYRLFKQSAETIKTKTDSSYTMDDSINYELTEYGNELYNSGANTYRRRGSTHTITIGDDFVQRAEMKELVTILDTDFCDMYLGKENGKDKWQRVLVEDATTKIADTDLQTFSVTIQLPTYSSQYK